MAAGGVGEVSQVFDVLRPNLRGSAHHCRRCSSDAKAMHATANRTVTGEEGGKSGHDSSRLPCGRTPVGVTRELHLEQPNPTPSPDAWLLRISILLVHTRCRENMNTVTNVPGYVDNKTVFLTCIIFY